MISDLCDVYIKGQQYATAARCYFEWDEDGQVRFKGGNADQMLTYCYETGEWRCDCWMYTTLPKIGLPALCPHTIAAKKSLPAPVPVVVQ